MVIFWSRQHFLCTSLLGICEPLRCLWCNKNGSQKNVTQFVKLFQNLFICYSFFLSKMTTQLQNNVFLSVDNFEKRKIEEKRLLPKNVTQFVKTVWKLICFSCFLSSSFLSFHCRLERWLDLKLNIMGQDTFYCI